MSSPQLGPFGELVLATRRVQFSPAAEVLLLQLVMLGEVLGGGGGERVT